MSKDRVKLNNFATSIQKVSEGMTVAGSIAKNAGVEVNELAASIGVMTAVTQRSGNEAGRAFRSILMNIRQIKGETEDGEIIDDAALSKSAKALDAVGIKVHELRNGVEELRNPMDVLKQLSSIWKDLSTMQQAPIIDAIGGKYRGNQLVALVENFTMYEDMLTKFANSANSAIEENEKRLTSWQSKVNQFTNAVSQMWNNTIDTNSVKSFIDFGTSVITVIDKIITTFGVVPPILTIVSLAFLTLTSKGKLLNLVFLDATKALAFGKIGLEQYVVALTSAGAAQTKLIATTLTFSTIMKGLGATITATSLALIRLFPPLAIIAGVTWAFQKLSETIKKNKEETKRLEEQNKKLAKTYSTQKDEINSLIKEYDKLSKIEKRNADEQERYLKISNELSEFLPTLTDSIDEKGQAHLRSSEAIAKEIEYIEKLTNLEREGRVLSTPDILGDIEKQRRKAEKEIAKLQQKLARDGESVPIGSMGGVQKLSEDEIRKINIKIINLQRSLVELGEESRKTFSQLVSDIFAVNNIQATDEIKQKIVELAHMYNWSADDIKKNSKDLVDAFAYDAALIGQSIDDVSESVNNLNINFEELANTLDDSEKKLSSLQSIMADLDKGNGLSLKNLQEIAKEHKHLMQYVTDETTLRQKLNEEMSKYETIAKEAFHEILISSESYFTELQTSNADFFNWLNENGYDNDLKNWKSLAEAKLGVETKLIDTLGTLWSSFYKLTAEQATGILGAMEYEAAMAGVSPQSLPGYKEFKNFAQLRSDIDTKFKDVTKDAIKINFDPKSGSSSTKEPKDIAKYESDKFQKAVDEVNNRILHSKYILSTYNEESEEYRNELRNQIALHRELLPLYHEEANRLRAKNKDIEDQLGKLGDFNTLKDEEKELYNKLKKEYDDNEKAIYGLKSAYMSTVGSIDGFNNSIDKSHDLLKKQQAELLKFQQDLGIYLINKEIEKLNEQKNALKEIAELRISAIQAEIDRLEERNDLLKEEETRQEKLLNLAKQRDKLANIQREKNVRMLVDGEWQWVANPRLLREETERLMEMQEDYFKWEEDLRKKREIQELKDQIKKIQDELKNEEAKYDKQITNLQNFIKEYQDSTSEFYKLESQALTKFITDIQNLEKLSYEDRIKALAQFVTEYNRLTASLASPTSAPITQQTTINSHKITDYADGSKTVSAPSGTTLFYNPDGSIDLNKSIIKKYHEGGEIGKPTKETEVIKKLFNLKGDEIPIIAQEGEFMLSKSMTRNFIPNMQKLFSSFQPALAGAGNSTINNNNYITVQKVQTNDARGFINKLKREVRS